MVEGELVVNPTVQQMKSSQLDMVLAGTKEAVLMIEVSTHTHSPLLTPHSSLISHSPFLSLLLGTLHFIC